MGTVFDRNHGYNVYKYGFHTVELRMSRRLCLVPRLIDGRIDCYHFDLLTMATPRKLSDRASLTVNSLLIISMEIDDPSPTCFRWIYWGRRVTYCDAGC